MNSGRSNRGETRQITGRMVLVALLGFFGFVTLVNIVMVHAAISTFGGVDTPSSYKAGLAFKAEADEAEEQANRQWQVDARVAPTADSNAVSFEIHDADGRPVIGAEVTARLQHPIDERRDVLVVVSEVGSGVYHGRASIGPGQWTLDFEIAKGGQRMFRSRNRIAVE